MLFSKNFLLAALPLVSAAPVLEKRALSANDIAVLQLAHYLENLEYALYSGGYNKFSDADFAAAGFTDPYYRAQIGQIASHEATHRDTLASVLTAGGQTPLPPCTYTFPYTTPTQFVDLSNMITTVGIGAYLGGATLIMDNPTLLTEATSILTVEARHDSFLRTGLYASPFPAPFDTSLTALWAYNLAHTFIESCPMELPGQVLLPKLTMTAPAPLPHLTPAVAAGTALSFTWDYSTFFVKNSVPTNTPVYVAFINQVAAPSFVPIGTAGANAGSVKLPSGLGNAAFAVLTTFSGGLNETQLTSYGTLAGPAEILLS